MISCARGVSGRSAHRRTLVKSVVFYSAPALRGNLRLLMAALGRLKDIVFIAILQLNGASDPSKHRRPVLKIRCVLTPLQSAAFSMFPGSGGRGGFWKKLILVHVLVRSLCSALSALCTLILLWGRTAESSFQELSNQHSLNIGGMRKISLQWRGGFPMLFEWSSIGSPEASMEVGH